MTPVWELASWSRARADISPRNDRIVAGVIGQPPRLNENIEQPRRAINRVSAADVFTSPETSTVCNLVSLKGNRHLGVIEHARVVKFGGNQVGELIQRLAGRRDRLGSRGRVKNPLELTR